MSFKSNLKVQFDALSTKALKAEKAAEKKLKEIIKSSESFRSDQLKHTKNLLKKARTLRQGNLVKQAEKIKAEIEGRATAGLDHLMKKINFPTRKEMEALKKKLATIQKRVEDLESEKKA